MSIPKLVKESQKNIA